MIREAWDEGMPIVQVKVHLLAEPAQPTYDLETSGNALPTASWMSATRSGNR